MHFTTRIASFPISSVSGIDEQRFPRTLLWVGRHQSENVFEQVQDTLTCGIAVYAPVAHAPFAYQFTFVAS